MKTTVRIITLAFMFGLAGVLTTAWGAESVVNLISQGETLIAKVKSSQATLDAATKKNSDLAAEGKQIIVEQQQLKADIAAYQKQNDNVKQLTGDYKSKCDGKQLNAAQFTDCKAQLAQINTDIDAVNSQPAKLNKRQNDFIKRANEYNQEVQSTPKQVRAADTTYRDAMVSQYEWLDKARTMVASPAFQPYAKKADCPNVKNPAKTPEAAMKMSDEILTCLKKVAGTN